MRLAFRRSKEGYIPEWSRGLSALFYCTNTHLQTAAMKVMAIRNLMETMKRTAEQAMGTLRIPADQRGMYAERIERK